VRATVIERIGISAGVIGLVGFVFAASTISIVLALVVASAFLVGGGVLGVWIAARIPDKKPEKPKESER
jgi:hypothetical protein